MRQIVMYPNKVLRKKVPEVVKVAEILTETEGLREVLEDSKNGAGLAATQLAIEKRFFGMKDGKKVNILVNPKILGVYGQKTYPMMVGEKEKDEEFLEGCLSFPDLYGTVKRYLKIEVEWQEIKRDKFVSKKKTMSGFEAIVFQHELDHLDGILFVDHIKEDGGKLYKFVKDKKIEWGVEKVMGEELITN